MPFRGIKGLSGPVHFCAAAKAKSKPVQWYTLRPRFIALLDRLAIANAGGEGDGGALASLSSLGLRDPRAGRLQPGSVLVREHGGVVHHVMVLVDGFAWNGQTYSSLSKVALAITGTTWNGRRFFGIDARTPRGTESRAPGKSKGTAATGNAP